MADTRTPEQRRRIMQSVKGKDTGPEMVVRRWLFSRGYRYRLHTKTLPGKPDIVMPGRRLAIFVHGCFWHGHDCIKGRAPKSRLDYWKPKLDNNRERDERKASELRALGWEVLTLWQCDIADAERLARILERALEKEQNTIDKTE